MINLDNSYQTGEGTTEYNRNKNQHNKPYPKTTSINSQSSIRDTQSISMKNMQSIQSNDNITSNHDANSRISSINSNSMNNTTNSYNSSFHHTSPSLSHSTSSTNSDHSTLALVNVLQQVMGNKTNPGTRNLTIADQLCAAAYLGNANQVEQLLLHGAPINRCGLTGWTALHEAVNGHHHSIIELLCNNGADPGTLSKTKKTALDLALTINDSRAVHILHTNIEQKMKAHVKNVEKKLTEMQDEYKRLFMSISVAEKNKRNKKRSNKGGKKNEANSSNNNDNDNHDDYISERSDGDTGSQGSLNSLNSMNSISSWKSQGSMNSYGSFESLKKNDDDKDNYMQRRRRENQTSIEGEIKYSRGTKEQQQQQQKQQNNEIPDIFQDILQQQRQQETENGYLFGMDYVNNSRNHGMNNELHDNGVVYGTNKRVERNSAMEQRTLQSQEYFPTRQPNQPQHQERNHQQHEQHQHSHQHSHHDSHQSFQHEQLNQVQYHPQQQQFPMRDLQTILFLFHGRMHHQLRVAMDKWKQIL